MHEYVSVCAQHYPVTTYTTYYILLYSYVLYTYILHCYELWGSIQLSHNQNTIVISHCSTGICSPILALAKDHMLVCQKAAVQVTCTDFTLVTVIDKDNVFILCHANLTIFTSSVLHAIIWIATKMFWLKSNNTCHSTRLRAILLIIWKTWWHMSMTI